MMNFLKTLGRDNRGTSVVELGLITPILASLIIGTVDLSKAYSEKLRLEQSAHRAIERVQALSANGTTSGTLKAEAAEAAEVDADNVTVDYWLECNGVRADDYDTTCASGQSYARYLTVTITDEYEPFFPLRTFGANANGKYDINGQAGIRTQ